MDYSPRLRKVRCFDVEGALLMRPIQSKDPQCNKPKHRSFHAYIKKKKMNRQVGAAIGNVAVFKFIVADCEESTFRENQMFQTIQ